MKADKPTKLKSDCKRSTLDGVPYSTEFCRRRRLEVQTLQVEAETLAAQLSELQANGAAAPACQCPSTASSTQWRSAAVVERGKRKCAEEINRRLKATLEELTKLHDSFLRALNKPQTLKDLDFVAQMEPNIDRPPSQRRFSDTVLKEMCNNLDWLRLDTDTVFPLVENGPNVSFCWQFVPDTNSIQASSITPVACSVHELGEMLWRRASNSGRETDKAFRYIQRKSPSPLDVNVVASLLEGLLCVNSVSTYRRYDEGDRVILVGTTKWFLSTGELVLQDFNWTVISGLPEDPLHSCVSRNFYKLERAPNAPTHTEQAERLFSRLSATKCGASIS
ncbi:hypothetical protein PF008_g29927 [Phytophthora fragariae]|uniref:Uncharacterized protein n=1 Tax=Phytophthora fragariae TaxID=53985 RepID=A0A6G0Q7P4_9STRA|nr:hypothetical protein PF008_g29927 [Phytophthora fragariae]